MSWSPFIYISDTTRHFHVMEDPCKFNNLSSVITTMNGVSFLHKIQINRRKYEHGQWFIAEDKCVDFDTCSRWVRRVSVCLRTSDVPSLRQAAMFGT